jgi:hypothetical protein
MCEIFIIIYFLQSYERALRSSSDRKVQVEDGDWRRRVASSGGTDQRTARLDSKGFGLVAGCYVLRVLFSNVKDDFVDGRTTDS